VPRLKTKSLNQPPLIHAGQATQPELVQQQIAHVLRVLDTAEVACGACRGWSLLAVRRLTARDQGELSQPLFLQ
jgi:hypothetical protein